MFEISKVKLEKNNSIIIPNNILKKYNLNKNDILIFEIVSNPQRCIIIKKTNQ